MAREKRRSKRASKPATAAGARRPLAPAAELAEIPRTLAPAAAALGLVALIIYALTLYRTVPGGDSGELILAAENLGVAHPPGYPLFTLLGKLFSLVPIGEVSARINFLSAVCDAGAAVLLALAVGRWTRQVAPALLAGGLFAFSPLIWRYAVAAEVFALNNLFAAGLIYFTVRFFQARQEDQFSLARKAALWIGLGLANHHTLLFFAVPLTLWILWSGRRELVQPKRLLALAACLCLGLSIYIYLPIGSAHLAVPSWGDETTLAGFFTHFLRSEYGTFQLAAGELPPGANLWPALWQFISGEWRNLLYAGAPLALIGIATTLANPRWRPRGRILFLALASYLATFSYLSNLPLDFPLKAGIQVRFWQQAHLFICAWTGVGFAWAIARAPSRFSKLWLPLAALLVPLQIVYNYRTEDRSHADVFRRFARSVLDPLPPHAMLLSSGDHVTHALLYYQQNESLRPDVQIVDLLALTRPWYKRQLQKHLPAISLPGDLLNAGAPRGYDFKAFLDRNQQFPLFIVNGFRLNDSSYKQGYFSWPTSFVEQLLPHGQDLPLQEWMSREHERVDTIDPHSLEAYPLDSWEREVLRQYWLERESYAAALINYAHARGDNREALEEAVRESQQIAAKTQFPDPQIYKNLGGAYQLLLQYDPIGARAGMLKAWTTYLAAPLPNDKDIAQIRTLLK